MKNFLKNLKKPKVIKANNAGKSRYTVLRKGQGAGGSVKNNRRIFEFLAKMQDGLRGLLHGQRSKPSWKTRNRGMGGRYWLPFVLMAFMFVIWGGSRWVVRSIESSGLFRIANSSCVGCKIVSNQELLDRAGIIMHHTSLLAMRTEQMEKVLKESIPWLATVRVEKDYPAAVHFFVQEKKPIAILHSPHGKGSEFFYLNRNGEAVFSVPPGGNIDLPVLTGIDMIQDPEIKEKALQEAIAFLSRVKENDPVLPLHLISELHANHDGELVCFLVDYPFPIYLGKDKMENKYQRLTVILADLYRSAKKNAGKGIKGTSYILMKYAGEKVYIGMGA